MGEITKTITFKLSYPEIEIEVNFEESEVEVSADGGGAWNRTFSFREFGEVLRLFHEVHSYLGTYKEKTE